MTTPAHQRSYLDSLSLIPLILDASKHFHSSKPLMTKSSITDMVLNPVGAPSSHRMWPRNMWHSSSFCHLSSRFSTWLPGYHSFLAFFLNHWLFLLIFSTSEFFKLTSGFWLSILSICWWLPNLNFWSRHLSCTLNSNIKLPVQHHLLHILIHSL